MRRGGMKGKRARPAGEKAPSCSSTRPSAVAAPVAAASPSPSFRLPVAPPQHHRRALPPAHLRTSEGPQKPPGASSPSRTAPPAPAPSRRRGIRPRSPRATEPASPAGAAAPSTANRPPGMPSDEAVEAAAEFLWEVDRLRKLVTGRPEVLPDTTGVVIGAVLVSGIGDGVMHAEEIRRRSVAHGLHRCRVVTASERELERLLFFTNLYRAVRSVFDDFSQFLRARSNEQEASHAEPPTSRHTLVLFETTTLSTPRALNAVENFISEIDATIVTHPVLPIPLVFTADPLDVTDLRYLFFDLRGWSLIARGDIRPYQTAPGWRALTRLVSLRCWLLKNFTAAEQERFLLIGSSALFMYGIRVPGDIDLYVHNPEGDLSFVNAIERAIAEGEGTLFNSVDVILRGYGKWSLDAEGSEYVQTLVENYFFAWPASFGAEDMDAVMRDAQFHARFLGIKCVSLAGDVARRVRRIRPAAYADLIAIQRDDRFRDICEPIVPQLTDYVFEEHHWRYLSPGERPRFFETVRLYLKNRFGTSIPVTEIQSILENGPVVIPFRYPTGEALERLEEQRSRENLTGSPNGATRSPQALTLVVPDTAEATPTSPNSKKATNGLRLRSIGGRGTVTVVSRVVN